MYLGGPLEINPPIDVTKGFKIKSIFSKNLNSNLPRWSSQDALYLPHNAKRLSHSAVLLSSHNASRVISQRFCIRPSAAVFCEPGIRRVARLVKRHD